MNIIYLIDKRVDTKAENRVKSYGDMDKLFQDVRTHLYGGTEINDFEIIIGQQLPLDVKVCINPLHQDILNNALKK
jgi:hypothetical protein